MDNQKNNAYNKDEKPVMPKDKDKEMKREEGKPTTSPSN